MTTLPTNTEDRNLLRKQREQDRRRKERLMALRRRIGLVKRGSDDFWTPRELAQILKVTVRTVRLYCNPTQKTNPDGSKTSEPPRIKGVFKLNSKGVDGSARHSRYLIPNSSVEEFLLADSVFGEVGHEDADTDDSRNN